MDTLRLTLLIVGIALVAGIYLYTRLSRRKSAARRAERDSAAGKSRIDFGNILDRRASAGPNSAGTDEDLEDLGGIFAPRRDTSDAELSVDVSVLSGLRATYESTIDGIAQIDEFEGSPLLDPIDSAEPAKPSVAAPEPPMPDMTRPLVYLALIPRDGSLSGRKVLDSLDGEGFRPGPMQLYYRQSDADPTIAFGIANQAEPGVLDPASLPDMETPGLVAFMSVPDDMAHAVKTYNMMVAVGRRLARRLDARLCDETRSTLTAQTENHLRETVGEIVRRERLKE